MVQFRTDGISVALTYTQPAGNQPTTMKALRRTPFGALVPVDIATAPNGLYLLGQVMPNPAWTQHVHVDAFDVGLLSGFLEGFASNCILIE